LSSFCSEIIQKNFFDINPVIIVDIRRIEIVK